MLWNIVSLCDWWQQTRETRCCNLSGQTWFLFEDGNFLLLTCFGEWDLCFDNIFISFFKIIRPSWPVCFWEMLKNTFCMAPLSGFYLSYLSLTIWQKTNQLHVLLKMVLVVTFALLFLFISFISFLLILKDFCLRGMWNVFSFSCSFSPNVNFRCFFAAGAAVFSVLS